MQACGGKLTISFSFMQWVVNTKGFSTQGKAYNGKEDLPRCMGEQMDVQ